MNIKKDDKVVVLSGKDKGKEGKVLSADPKGGKLIVEGVNVATKHQKPKNQQDQGGEDDLLTKLGDRPRFFDRLDHLDHLCLSARSLNCSFS